jgi:hypothetical protein
LSEGEKGSYTENTEEEAQRAQRGSREEIKIRIKSKIKRLYVEGGLEVAD